MPEHDQSAPQKPEPDKQNDTPESAPKVEAAAEAVKNEVDDLKDKLMRTLAEMENLRKRTERELSDTRQYAVASFARDMLTVADNLKRAIDAVPPEVRDQGDKAFDSLVEGVEVTARGLEQTLTKFGVKPVDAKGEKFDPQVHQAMYELETADIPSGHVAEVVQAGYAIGERVLRPALVAVAKAKKAVSPNEADKETTPEPGKAAQ